MSEPSVSKTPFEMALAKMCAPDKKGVICVDVTNKCDLACSNCTRLLANQDQLWEMSVDNFRQAVHSLRDYPGTVAVIGGNPAMHKNFAELCDVLTQEIPQKDRRGLWTNNILKYASLAKDTFGVFNLNPHGNKRGIESLQPLRDPKVNNYYPGHSTHAPILTAIKDLMGEEEMWGRIATCDINQNWSATIVQNKGNLRVYFCEVAASFDLARGEDHGFELTEGWWRQGIEHFADQVAHFCPSCGVPARLKGYKDSDEIDVYTHSNADLVGKSKKKRTEIELDVAKAEFDTKKVIDYSSFSRSRFWRFVNRMTRRIGRLVKN